MLLSPTVDSYFDKKDISFADDGTVLVGKNVAESIKDDFKRYRLDQCILNGRRKRYLAYHRHLFCGAGGLSLGFDNAGFKNIFSI